MQSSTGTFRGAAGVELFQRLWLPDEPPRAVVLLIHGIGEHCGRFAGVAAALTAHGLAVAAYDQRGHGRSPGQRGHINRWADYREDLRACHALVRRHFPALPLFLYGVSMGSLVALDYVLREPGDVRGVMVSGVPLQPTGAAKPWLVALVKVLSRPWPTLAFQLRLEHAALSRETEVVRAYQADPLVHGLITARWGTEMLATIAWVKAHAAGLRTPLLMVHGEADRINSAAGAREFWEAVQLRDKELYLDPGGYHEPHNDLNRAAVLQKIAHWMLRHLQP
jgi:alpha-beta hydrolase superfamily lysophospholipase